MMGPYALYIYAAYGLAALILGLLIWRSFADLRRAQKADKQTKENNAA